MEPSWQIEVDNAKYHTLSEKERDTLGGWIISEVYEGRRVFGGEDREMYDETQKIYTSEADEI